MGLYESELPCGCRSLWCTLDSPATTTVLSTCSHHRELEKLLVRREAAIARARLKLMTRDVCRLQAWLASRLATVETDISRIEAAIDNGSPTPRLLRMSRHVDCKINSMHREVLDQLFGAPTEQLAIEWL
jgi:hypothetical protein